MFCLMSNHIHLVCETPEGNISRFMQLKNSSRYTIGSLGFDSRIRSLYKKMIEGRDVADILNLKSGVAVSCQLRKLRKVIEESEELKSQLDEIAKKLELLQEKS